MQIALIWAMAANRVIGRDNGLPWRLPKDMRHFMSTTMGKPVIMGRKTFETMPGPLPGRTNIVLTRDEDYRRDGVEVAHTFDAAVAVAEERCRADGQDEAFVVGGADVYAMGLEIATRLYVTFVDAEPEGDTWFPEIDWQAWREVDSVSYPKDAEHAHGFRIVTFARA